MRPASNRATAAPTVTALVTTVPATVAVTEKAGSPRATPVTVTCALGHCTERKVMAQSVTPCVAGFQIVGSATSRKTRRPFTSVMRSSDPPNRCFAARADLYRCKPRRRLTMVGRAIRMSLPLPCNSLPELAVSLGFRCRRVLGRTRGRGAVASDEELKWIASDRYQARRAMTATGRLLSLTARGFPASHLHRRRHQGAGHPVDPHAPASAGPGAAAGAPWAGEVEAGAHGSHRLQAEPVRPLHVLRGRHQGLRHRSGIEFDVRKRPAKQAPAVDHGR